MGACAVILPNTNDNMEFGSEMLHSEADILYVGNDKFLRGGAAVTPSPLPGGTVDFT